MDIFYDYRFWSFIYNENIIENLISEAEHYLRNQNLKYLSKFVILKFWYMTEHLLPVA